MKVDADENGADMGMPKLMSVPNCTSSQNNGKRSLVGSSSVIIEEELGTMIVPLDFYWHLLRGLAELEETM